MIASVLLLVAAEGFGAVLLLRVLDGFVIIVEKQP